MNPRGFDFLKDVDVRLSVELGRTDMKLKDVMALGPDSVVVLDRMTDELLDVLVNGKAIAKGEIVAQNGRFGLRIIELAGAEQSQGDVAGVDFSALSGGGLSGGGLGGGALG